MKEFPLHIIVPNAHTILQKHKCVYSSAINFNTMLVKTFGSAVQGITATTVTVEVNISKGINFLL